MIAVCLFITFLSHGVFARQPVLEPEYLDFLRATGQDAEFARLMKIRDVSLVRDEKDLSEQTSTASHLGDILLTPEQLEQSRQGIDFNKYSGSKWRNNVIPFWISTSDFSAFQRSFILSAIVSLNNSLTNLKLRQWRSGDKDYAVVFSGRGCYSNLGRIGGEQSISIQKDGCMSRGTIQHEFIHAAGFLHEHMRTDRDNYIRILEENIPEDWRSQYEKASTDFVNNEPYDYYSVMHYPIRAPGTGLPAFEVLNKTIDQSRIGQRVGPSQRDINKVNLWYS